MHYVYIKESHFCSSGSLLEDVKKTCILNGHVHQGLDRPLPHPFS